MKLPHCFIQPPPLQDIPIGQARPHCPQFVELLDVSMDIPSQDRERVDLGQGVHRCVCPGGRRIMQKKKLAESYFRLMAMPLHWLQTPSVQDMPAAHLFPHCPQFAELLDVSMDIPSQ